MKKIQVRDDDTARINVVDYVNVKSENSFLKAKTHVDSKTSDINRILSELENRVKNIEDASESKRKIFEFNITTIIAIIGIVLALLSLLF